MFQDTTEIVGTLWAESRNRLHSFIARRVKNDADVEDILQDVFFKIYQNIDTLKDPEKIYPWVFQMTRNAIADYYRSRKAEFTEIDEDAPAFAIKPNDTSVEEKVLSWLEPMILELPDTYREALLLTDINGLTQKELSEKLDISLSGAKSRVQRGREKLKDILLDCCKLEFAQSGAIVEYRQQNADCAAC